MGETGPLPLLPVQHRDKSPFLQSSEICRISEVSPLRNQNKGISTHITHARSHARTHARKHARTHTEEVKTPTNRVNFHTFRTRRPPSATESGGWMPSHTRRQNTHTHTHTVHARESGRLLFRLGRARRSKTDTCTTRPRSQPRTASQLGWREAKSSHQQKTTTERASAPQTENTRIFRWITCVTEKNHPNPGQEPPRLKRTSGPGRPAGPPSQMNARCTRNSPKQLLINPVSPSSGPSETTKETCYAPYRRRKILPAPRKTRTISMAPSAPPLKRNTA